MFKFAVPTEDTTVQDFAYDNNTNDSTARYHLEKMVKAGVLTKSVELFEEEAAYYNPMRTHNWVNRAVYAPVEKQSYSFADKMGPWKSDSVFNVPWQKSQHWVA
jgi:hypothetical protein